MIRILALLLFTLFTLSGNTQPWRKALKSALFRTCERTIVSKKRLPYKTPEPKPTVGRRLFMFKLDSIRKAQTNEKHLPPAVKILQPHPAVKKASSGTGHPTIHTKKENQQEKIC